MYLNKRQSNLKLTSWLLIFSLFAFNVVNLFSPPFTVSAHSNTVTKVITVDSKSKHGEPNPSSISDLYRKRPMSFEVNQGQVDDRVKFLSRGSGYNLFLTSTEAVLALSVPVTQNKQGDIQQDVLRMKLLSANSSARVTGLEELPGTSNYLLGNDPKQWQTNVVHYARVRYENVYQGIDVVYYGNQQQLEYDFIVAPGADPSAIKLSFDGTQSIEIDPQGDLVLRTRRGEMRQHKPFMYQETDGQKHQVAGQYVKIGKEKVGFEIGAYDHSLPLVIDPLLIYSTYLGGSLEDNVYSIATDAAGNVYIAGFTSSPAFPTTIGAFQTALVGTGDAFVTKLDPSGSILQYSTYLGGSSSEYAVGVAIDSSGNAYLTGNTASLNFPITPGAFDPIGDSNGDTFVTKLDPSGTSLVYSTYLGGGGDDQSFGIAIDSLGQAYVTGSTKSLNFPVTFGVFDTTFNSSTVNMEDAYVTKMNTTGTGIVYSTFLGGSNRDIATGIAVSVSGNAYVTGMTQSANFPSTVGAFDNILSGFTDIFVLKLNTTASGFNYSTFIGGTGDDLGYAIAVDGSGCAYVTGSTTSTNFPTTSIAFDRVFGGIWDAFVTKVNSGGTGLVYSTYLGGSSVELGFGITVDGVGQAYVTGYTMSSDFPTTGNALDASYNGGEDVVVTKVNSSGSSLMYSSFHGGSSGNETGRGIALDASGNVYVGGCTNSTNFPTTPGAFATSYNGGWNDGFVSKFQL